MPAIKAETGSFINSFKTNKFFSLGRGHFNFLELLALLSVVQVHRVHLVRHLLEVVPVGPAVAGFVLILRFEQPEKSANVKLAKVEVSKTNSLRLGVAIYHNRR